MFILEIKLKTTTHYKLKNRIFFESNGSTSMTDEEIIADFLGTYMLWLNVILIAIIVFFFASAQDVVRNIMDHLMINSNGQETQV